MNVFRDQLSSISHNKWDGEREIQQFCSCLFLSFGLMSKQFNKTLQMFNFAVAEDQVPLDSSSHLQQIMSPDVCVERVYIEYSWSVCLVDSSQLTEFSHWNIVHVSLWLLVCADVCLMTSQCTYYDMKRDHVSLSLSFNPSAACRHVACVLCYIWDGVDQWTRLF